MTRKRVQETSKDLGYGLLLKRYIDDVTQADEDMIDKAAWDNVPRVLPMFWAFHIMVALGFYFIILFLGAFYLASRDKLDRYRWFLKLSFLSLPLPWIAAELGWFVAEYGRQPWTIEGILPTFLSSSGTSSSIVMSTLIMFIVFYTILAVIDLKLLIKYVRLGPDQALGSERQREKLK